MNYQETLDFLYNSLPTFHRIGATAFKPTLENTLALCKIAGDPHLKFPAIHIAGTNGKGSTSHMLAAILQECGYKTGLYTSPHLKNFTERFRINGSEMNPIRVMEFVDKYKTYIQTIKPSFFEMTTAMAFDHFAREKIDIGVIEVGLGGRLDSTNIITPLLSLITNISLDHQNILGETLPDIAREKAGIIKKNIPLVVSEHQEDVHAIFKNRTNELQATLTVASEKYLLKNEKTENGILTAEVFDNTGKKRFVIETDLSGIYQLRNIPGVLAAIDILRAQGWNITEEKIRSALKQVIPLTGLKGRWQVLGRSPLIICDTAHNEAGIQNIVRQINSISFNKLHFVLGTVNDKDVKNMIRMLPPNAYYYFCRPDIPRGLDAALLYSYAKEQGLEGEIASGVGEAILKAQAASNEGDLIFIGGSNFVVAEIPFL